MPKYLFSASLLNWFQVILPIIMCVFPVTDHVALSCDVSKEQEVQRTFEAIQKNCGNVGYLVNAAGINKCER